MRRHSYGIWEQPCSLAIGEVGLLSEDNNDGVLAVRYRPNEVVAVQVMLLPESPYSIHELIQLFTLAKEVWAKCEVSYSVLAATVTADERVNQIDGLLYGLEGYIEDGGVLPDCKVTIDCPNTVSALFNLDEEPALTLEAKIQEALSAALD